MIKELVARPADEIYDEPLILPVSLPTDEQIQNLALFLHKMNKPFTGTVYGWSVRYSPANTLPAGFGIGDSRVWSVSYDWEEGDDKPPYITRSEIKSERTSDLMTLSEEFYKTRSAITNAFTLPANSYGFVGAIGPAISGTEFSSTGFHWHTVALFDTNAFAKSIANMVATDASIQGVVASINEAVRSATIVNTEFSILTPQNTLAEHKEE